MLTSRDRILTTHVGSLPRNETITELLIKREAGEAIDQKQMSGELDRAVATLESYIGLVEVGVGLLPAGGGCKEFALRAAQDAREERVGHVGNQQRHRARAAQPQGLRGDVGPIAELARAAPHGLLRGRRHAPAALAREHERDRRLRDARAPRHVSNGRRGWLASPGLRLHLRPLNGFIPSLAYDRS